MAKPYSMDLWINSKGLMPTNSSPKHGKSQNDFRWEPDFYQMPGLNTLEHDHI